MFELEQKTITPQEKKKLSELFRGDLRNPMKLCYSSKNQEFEMKIKLFFLKWRCRFVFSPLHPKQFQKCMNKLLNK